MSDTLKLGLIIILAVVVGGFVWKLIAGLVSGILGIVVPLAFIAGIGLVAYGLFSRKALGGRRRYLP